MRSRPAAVAAVTTGAVLALALSPSEAPGSDSQASTVQVVSEPVPFPHARPAVRLSRSLKRPARPAKVRVQPRASTPSRVVPVRRTGGAINWDAIAKCESGGHWNHHTSANGYWGGLQISLQTWFAFHGDRIAARPDLATKAQQIHIAEHIERAKGLGAWPVCGRFA